MMKKEGECRSLRDDISISTYLCDILEDLGAGLTDPVYDGVVM